MSREATNCGDFLEVGGAGKNHERVGGVAGGDLDDFLGLLAGELLIERLDFLGQFRGVDVFQDDGADDDVVVLFHVEGGDEGGGGGQIVVVVGHDHEIGAVIGDDDGILGKDAFDLVGEIGGGEVLEGKDLDEALTAAGNRFFRRAHQFGGEIHFGLLVGRDDEDGGGGFDGGEAFHAQGAIDHGDGFLAGDFFDDRQW